MKKFSKTAIVGVISLVSVVATVGLAGAATYSNSGHLTKKPGIFATGGCDNIGPRGFMDLNIVAQDLGIQLTDLTTELKSGKSIKDIAAAKGVDTAKLTTDLQNAASSKIDEAVKAGKLTADQATTIKSNVSKQIQDMLSRQGQGPMNNTSMDRKNGIGFGGPRGFVDLTIVAKALNNMPLTDLTIELKAGKSISDIAAAKGVDTAKLTQDLQTAASTKIDEAVKAGKLTADQATTMKANIAQKVQAFLNSKGHGPKTKMGHNGSFRANKNSSTQTNL